MPQLSQKIDAQNLHHAYLIEGEGEQILPELVLFLESIGIPCAGNPNVSRQFLDLMTIEESRSIKERQIESGIGEGKKIFIIGARFFTIEAQNALLKIFEEPARDVHFFLITPKADKLLDTLKSRLAIIRLDDASKKNNDAEAGRRFLQMSKGDRIKKIAEIIKNHDDEDVHSSLKSEATDLLNSIECALWKQFGEKPTKENEAIFKEITKCRGYLADRGASTKMLLEHIALILLEK